MSEPKQSDPVIGFEVDAHGCVSLLSTADRRIELSGADFAAAGERFIELLREHGGLPSGPLTAGRYARTTTIVNGRRTLSFARVNT